MKTWIVTVEDKHGIIANHFVEAVFKTSAIEHEENLGHKVLHAREFRGQL